MAMDPEQYRQRRAARQQRLERQNRRRRKTIIGLICAGVIVLLCAILIAVLAGRNADRGNAYDQTTASGTAPNTTAAVEDKTVIHLAAAGDLNVTEAVVASGGADYNYTDTFIDVAHILADADVAMVNFEGNLYGTPYGTDFSAPQTLAQALASAGVDLVQLANSYSIYKGMEGLSSTISGIKLAGMEPLGAYATAAEAGKSKGYTIRTVQGVKIAFVAFTKGMDGMALPAGNEGCVNVLYTDYSSEYQNVDTEGISAILDAAAKEKPDITVALLHWGSEFNDTISATQEQICTLMQSKGVDAIIGTHSHYVQKMVYDEDAGTFVAYSLGDFLGDASRSGSEYSAILDLEITKNNESGQTKITGYSYTPIFTVNEEGRQLRVMRIDQAMKAYEDGYIDRISETSYEAMKYALTRIEKRITG